MATNDDKVPIVLTKGNFACLVPKEGILQREEISGFYICNEDEWEYFIRTIMKWDFGLSLHDCPANFPVVVAPNVDFIGGEIVDVFDCYDPDLNR